ncbi:TetR family transcriptional regulator [Streptomyces sp. NPDC051211]|uniref:TetR/AcrR family transcriptional regulator n=1 Tax=Streptomyces sp. NPDC051211 TaxID=3154643 RepID=UPI00344DBAFD
MTHQRPAPRAPAGLRERKKQRTRDALLRSALVLFTSKGYEQTTVDEITEAVEVSQRTFFRYFANKEEAAFAVQDLVEAHFLAALAARPAAEGPMEAMRHAVLDAWDTIEEAISDVVPVDLHMRAYRLIESTPALLAVHLRRSTELEERTARLIARREGLDLDGADADPRPRVAVAAFSGVIRMTGRLWGRGQDNSVAAIRRMTEDCLDQIGPALAAVWHGPPGGRPAAEGCSCSCACADSRAGDPAEAAPARRPSV